MNFLTKLLPISINICKHTKHKLFPHAHFKCTSMAHNAFSRSYAKFTNTMESNDEDSEDGEYQQLVNRYLRVPDMGHQVLVVQPYVKWGPGKKRNTTPQLQLDEAVSLIRTLSKWQVVDKITIPVDKMDKKIVFGSGNLEKLKILVKRNKNITAVFISVSMMKGFQKRDFEKLFDVEVYDRYSIVIQIFKEHAKSSEAKLQVSLAEIPYLRAMLSGGNESLIGRQGGGGSATPLRGSGESTLDAGKKLLEGVESKLRNKLKKIREQRSLSRKKREKLNFPVVAVVGYTNAGKTCLIKALTGEKTMQPSNTLFATLDVTTHEGLLPCRLKVLYVDTVGFMSELPSNLIECFLATLEDVMLADVILHVCDLSHPDVKAQVANVLDTLKQLQVPESVIKKIITVGNKCDKETLYNLDDKDLEPIQISATQLKGIAALEEEIQRSVLTETGRNMLIIRVPAGGNEASWLYKEAAVTDVSPDPENPQYMRMSVIITKVQLAKFKKQFLSS